MGEQTSESEISLQCAESALQSVIGDLSHTYFVGNAPMGHMVLNPTESSQDVQPLKVASFLTSFIIYNVACISFSYSSSNFLMSTSIWLLCQRFFFKSQVIATNKFDIGRCDDFVWVTKDELLEYFPDQAEFLNKMVIS